MPRQAVVMIDQLVGTWILVWNVIKRNVVEHRPVYDIALDQSDFKNKFVASSVIPGGGGGHPRA